MGTEFSFPTEIPVRQPPRTDGQSAGHRPPRYCIPSRHKGREDSKNGVNRFSHAYPAVWTVRRPGRTKFECALPHAVP